MRAVERECSRLLVAYTQAIDRGEAEAAADLFTEDGVFVAGPRRLQGHADLLKITEGRPPGLISRHLLGSVLVTSENARDASSVAYYVVFRGERTAGTGERPLPMELPFSMGEWHSRFELTAGGWRIARQEVKRLFQERSSAPAAPSPLRG